ncbi:MULTISPECIES: hypothetical protein [unclassified Paraburkholderia]|uniref:DUF7673 family protein n=1 Tax=unclassified Paraburkholderia TaxID=2615204 RepID=UPI00160BE6C4|nr:MULTISPECIES: hypothetical protein [unclassified Paraburkholderia]MBB5441426.1 hypothetical protein [Paraburkholderia sp. WSM4177]MBB5481821.1 hypothetical protein [Paraburkholderia sp. WSM4180]
MSTHDPFAAFMNKVLRGYPHNQSLIDEGRVALRRLYEFALGDTGESCVIAMVLLGLYDATRFPLPVQELRMLDRTLIDDVLRVLRMDLLAGSANIHHYFWGGEKIFEHLAKFWDFGE